jgi:hypothetical protein
MRRKLCVLAAILAVALMAAPASATLFTFTGNDAAGDPVSVQAVVTTGNDQVIVDLSNLTTPMLNAGQLLSDFSFTLSAAPTDAVTLNASGATIRTMTSTAGTFTTSSGFPGWALSSSGNTITLDDLAAGGSGPKNTILGPAVGGTYSTANASIVGVNANVYKDAHSPFLFGTPSAPVEWILNVPGITASTHVDSVTFSFGTESGDNHTVVPIPATALLLGSGLLGLVGLGWRRKRG